MNPILSRMLSAGTFESAGEQIALHSNMSLGEGELISGAFKFAKAARSLEVGCAYGVSALFACDALAENASADRPKHIIIDPFQSTQWRGLGMSNLIAAGYLDIVDLREERSEFALPALAAQGTQIDAAIVDGWHTLDHTLIDLFYVNRMLRTGGAIVLDDTNLPAINRILRYFLKYPAYRLGAVAGVPSSLSNYVADLVHRELQSPFGGLRPDWKEPPAQALGTAVVLIKVGEDDRPWNWFADF
jgi:predicted O-methyltransferase YrrM